MSSAYNFTRTAPETNLQHHLCTIKTITVPKHCPDDPPQRYRHLNFPRWRLSAAILDLAKPQIAPFDPPTPKTPAEPNMKWIGRPLAEIWPFEISPIWAKWEVGRSSVGRSRLGRSVGSQYILLTFLHWSHILLFATLGTYRARSKKTEKVPIDKKPS